jgi:hypothetical protein
VQVLVAGAVSQKKGNEQQQTEVRRESPVNGNKPPAPESEKSPMTVKHTASPWELKILAGTGGPQAIVKHLPGGIDAIVCLFIRSVGMSKEEEAANAKLIQKAPDLLHFLIDLNAALYPVVGDPVGVMRVNERDIYQLRYLLREIGEL